MNSMHARYCHLAFNFYLYYPSPKDLIWHFWITVMRLNNCFLMPQFGISPERLQANNDLCGFFKILTTSVDKKNKVHDIFYPFAPLWNICENLIKLYGV